MGVYNIQKYKKNRQQKLNSYVVMIMVDSYSSIIKVPSGTVVVTHLFVKKY